MYDDNVTVTLTNELAGQFQKFLVAQERKLQRQIDRHYATVDALFARKYVVTDMVWTLRDRVSAGI